MLRVAPTSTLDPTTTAFELFRDGPMEIIVARIAGNQVDIGISAHPDLLILRDEFSFHEWRRSGARARPTRRAGKRS
jgi:hypothetical protein